MALCSKRKAEREKSAQQTKHSSAHFSVSFRLTEDACGSHILCLNYKKKIERIDPKMHLCLSLYLEVMSLKQSWQFQHCILCFCLYHVLHVQAGGPEESFGCFALTLSKMNGAERLKPSGLGAESVSWQAGLGHNEAKVLHIVNHTVILEKLLDLLFTSQILSALCSSRLSVMQGAPSKGLEAWDCDKVQREAGLCKRGEKGSAVHAVTMMGVMVCSWKRQGCKCRCGL